MNTANPAFEDFDRGDVVAHAGREPAQVAWRLSAWIRRHAKATAALPLLFVLMFPFLWLVQLAFRPAADIFDDALLFTPTLQAFTGLLQGNFLRSFGNSLLVSTLSTVLSLVIGVPAAYALARWKFPGRSQVALWILVTRMAPPIAFTIPFYLAYRWLGLQD